MRIKLTHLVYLFFIFQIQISTAKSTDAKTFLDSGIANFDKGNYSQAISNFQESIEKAKQESNKKILSNAYNNIANCYANTGNSIDALKNYQNAISIAEQIKDTLRIAKSLKNIGTLYSEQKDFNMALSFYDKALKLARIFKDSSIIADCYNNQGVVFEQQKNYALSATIYAKALNIYRAEGNEERISMGLNNLGIVYKYLGNYDISIANYEEASQLATKGGDKFMIAATLNNLGGVYALKGDNSKALHLFFQALDTAKKIKATEIIIENYDGIANAYESLKKYPEAIQYRKFYETEKNDFINASRSEQLIEIQTKYETEKKESEIKLLKQTEQINKLKIAEQKFEIQKRNYVLSGIILLLSGIALAFYFWTGKQKLKNKLARDRAIQETEENERIRIAKDIHDDLGSGLSKINFLSELISQKAIQIPEIKNNSEAVSETAKRMVENMRDLIWALNPENTTLANLIARIREYTADYLEDFPIEIKSIYPDDIPQSPITKESHRGIFMVVKECLNNIVKHASASELQIAVQVTEEVIAIQLQDNGIGFDTNSPAAGNGLRNMRTRMSSCGGTISIQSAKNKGTKVEIAVPLNLALKA